MPLWCQQGRGLTCVVSFLRWCACGVADMSHKELEDVVPGEARRKIHDDITIIVLRLGSAPAPARQPTSGPARCATP